MPSAFNKAEARNEAESNRIHQLMTNLEFLNQHKPSNSKNNSWLWYWENNNGNGLSELNIERIQNASRLRKANPTNYTNSKMYEKLVNLGNKIMSRRWMYGYVPKVGANWVEKGGLKVPPHLPEWEVRKFRRIGKPRAWSVQGVPKVLARNTMSTRWRNAFTAEGTLKPLVHTARRKPSPAKPRERHLPTLKELAWKATPMATMTNEQLKFMSQMTPMNLTMLKPKKRASPLPPNNITKYRRRAAAHVIGKAARKHLERKAAQRVKGPSPRSPATLARQANLGIMGGVRRPPGVLNTRRITWTRNANGKISIHKTLRNLNLSMTQAMRNILENMPQNRAMNVIRQMARQR